MNTNLNINMKNYIKNFILIISVFLATHVQGQEQGIAIYTVEPSIDEDDFMYESLTSNFPDVLDFLEELSFQLVFDMERSYFTLEDKLFSDDHKVLAASLLVHFSGDKLKNEYGFLSDISTSPMVKEKWLESQCHSNWEITQESKEIKGYKVYKAKISYQEGNDLSGFITKNATAWFCPEINLPHGPQEFCGLPGLIFELQTPHATFGLTSIVFKEVTFPDVKEDEIISKEDFNKLMNQQVKKYNFK